ncbi:MAG: CoA-transferase, partial [Candidatus Caldarchaeum sp.]
MTLVDVRLHRRKAEEKDKSLRLKVMSLSEAVSKFVFDGAAVALGGCLYSRTPMAAVHEIIRQNRKNLTLIRNLAGYEVDLL